MTNIGCTFKLFKPMKKTLEEKIGYSARDLGCYLWEKALKNGSTKTYDWAIAYLTVSKRDCEEELQTRAEAQTKTVD